MLSFSDLFFNSLGAMAFHVKFRVQGEDRYFPFGTVRPRMPGQGPACHAGPHFSGTIHGDPE